MCVFVLQISFFRESVCLAASYAWVCQGNFHKCCNSRSKGSQTSPICSIHLVCKHPTQKDDYVSSLYSQVLPEHLPCASPTWWTKKTCNTLCKRGLFFVLFCLFPYLEFGDSVSLPGPSAMFWWLNCSVWRHLLSIWPMTNERTWVLLGNILPSNFFFFLSVSHVLFCLAKCQNIIFCKSLKSDCYWWNKISKPKNEVSSPFFLHVFPKA